MMHPGKEPHGGENTGEKTRLCQSNPQHVHHAGGTGTRPERNTVKGGGNPPGTTDTGDAYLAPRYATSQLAAPRLQDGSVVTGSTKDTLR